jgi:hypothetical protein
MPGRLGSFCALAKSGAHYGLCVCLESAVAVTVGNSMISNLVQHDYSESALQVHTLVCAADNLQLIFAAQTWTTQATVANSRGTANA